MISFYIFFVILTSNLLADQSCHGTCSKDGYPLPCGVWLKNETKSVTLGTYDLGRGVAKLYCSFSSLPDPVQIQWMFRPAEPQNSQWREFPCSKKEEKKNCQEDEIIVESSCEVRTNELTLSGTYRCSASVPNQVEQRYRAFSSEFPINVVGIQSPRVVSSHLSKDRHGHIEMEICANPRPEIFWHTIDGIILPKDSSHRFATTALTPRKILKNPNDPVSPIPYCYATSLLIHNVQENDQFRMSIRGELTTLHEKISVRVKSCGKLYFFVVSMISIVFYFY